MPSETISPAQMAFAGGVIGTNAEMEWLSPARLAWSGGTVAEGPEAGVTTSVTAPELDNWTRWDRPESIPEADWQRWMARDQRQTDAIEAALKGLTSQVVDLTAIVNRLSAAETLAAKASESAAETRATQDLADSYTDPPTVLTADNAGTVTIAAHARVYPVSGTRKDVAGGTITGFKAGDYVTVHYPDAARSGGAVAYQGSVSPVAQTGTTHVVGQVEIPGAGEAPVNGNGPSAPGYTPRENDRGGYEYL